VGAPPPLGGENFFRRTSHGKFVSAPPARHVHPSGGARVNFRTFLLCREVLELELVVLDRLFRLLEAKTKKDRQIFQGKKVHRLLKATSKNGRKLCEEKSASPDKILATPIVVSISGYNRVHLQPHRNLN